MGFVKPTATANYIIHCENHDFVQKSWREICDKSVKKAQKPLKLASCLYFWIQGGVNSVVKCVSAFFVWEFYKKKTEKTQVFGLQKGPPGGFQSWVGETVMGLIR